METNDSYKPVKHHTKALIGAIIAGAGAALLLFNLEIIDSAYRPLVFSWQTLLIVAGLINLFSRNNLPTGLILLTVGSVLLGYKYYGAQIDFFRIIIPLMLILVGIIIIFKKSKPKKERPQRPDANSYYRCDTVNAVGNTLDEVNIFSGSKRIYTDTPFAGGSIVNVFGGVELDLRQTELKEGTTRLECVNVFGGMVLIVPEDWEIKSETIAILGGFSDKRKSINFRSGNKLLIIEGVNVFGGTEVKNEIWVK